MSWLLQIASASAAMNIGVHVSFRIMVLSGYMPRSRIAIKELIYKTETDLQISKTNFWLPKGKRRWGEEINQEFEINKHTLLYR